MSGSASTLIVGKRRLHFGAGFRLDPTPRCSPPCTLESGGSGSGSGDNLYQVVRKRLYLPPGATVGPVFAETAPGDCCEGDSGTATATGTGSHPKPSASFGGGPFPSGSAPPGNSPVTLLRQRVYLPRNVTLDPLECAAAPRCDVACGPAQTVTVQCGTRTYTFPKSICLHCHLIAGDSACGTPPIGQTDIFHTLNYNPALGDWDDGVFPITARNVIACDGNFMRMEMFPRGVTLEPGLFTDRLGGAECGLPDLLGAGLCGIVSYSESPFLIVGTAHFHCSFDGRDQRLIFTLYPGPC